MAAVTHTLNSKEIEQGPTSQHFKLRCGELAQLLVSARPCCRHSVMKGCFSRLIVRIARNSILVLYSREISEFELEQAESKVILISVERLDETCILRTVAFFCLDSLCSPCCLETLCIIQFQFFTLNLKFMMSRQNGAEVVQGVCTCMHVCVSESVCVCVCVCVCMCLCLCVCAYV